MRSFGFRLVAAQRTLQMAGEIYSDMDVQKLAEIAVAKLTPAERRLLERDDLLQDAAVAILDSQRSHPDKGDGWHITAAVYALRHTLEAHAARETACVGAKLALDAHSERIVSEHDYRCGRPDPRFAEIEDREWLEYAIAQLDGPARQVMERVARGETIGAIAGALGRSEQWVRELRARALAGLRAQVAQV